MRQSAVLFCCFRYALLEAMSIEAVLFAEDDKLPANEARLWSIEWP